MQLLSVYNPEEEKILRSSSRMIDKNDRDNWLVAKVILEMKEFAEKYPNSVWFSAVQLWYPIQLFYINCRPTPSFPNMEIFQSFVINPLIKSKSDRIFDGYEWCMSIADDNGIPTKRRRISRSLDIVFDYVDEMWILHQDSELHDFVAVIWQHEYDHLHGKMIDEIGYDEIMQQEYLDRKNSWEKWLIYEW